MKVVNPSGLHLDLLKRFKEIVDRFKLSEVELDLAKDGFIYFSYSLVPYKFKKLDPDRYRQSQVYMIITLGRGGLPVDLSVDTLHPLDTILSSGVGIMSDIETLVSRQSSYMVMSSVPYSLNPSDGSVKLPEVVTGPMVGESYDRSKVKGVSEVESLFSSYGLGYVDISSEFSEEVTRHSVGSAAYVVTLNTIRGASDALVWVLANTSRVVINSMWIDPRVGDWRLVQASIAGLKDWLDSFMLSNDEPVDYGKYSTGGSVQVPSYVRNV